jgi:hypothetical protein
LISPTLHKVEDIALFEIDMQVVENAAFLLGGVGNHL